MEEDLRFTNVACRVWQPLEIREARPEKARKVQKLGLLLPESLQPELNLLVALESGRYSVDSVAYNVTL